MLKAYKSDVLLCLADLSNDEVFTPPAIANRMLDLLPQEIWGNPNIKILDPAAKSGVFLREAAKRMLNAQVPDFQKNLDEMEERKRNGKALTQKQLQFQEKLQDKINHIFRHQLFALPITELTALLTRRSVYCSKDAMNEHSVVQGFDNGQGNMRFFADIAHEWENGKCKSCGASAKTLDREDGKEQHAYAFIHYEQLVKKWSEIQDMHFDVIIGNPPYQLSDGGAQASAKPIYHLFVEQAKKLNPDYLVMITPARFFTGGKGLDDYRENFIHDKRIAVLHDFANSKEIFSGVDIKGGVCYFLRDNVRPESECEIHRHNIDGENISHRYLCEDGDNIFIRESQLVSIKRKVQALGEPTMDLIASPRKPYGLAGDAIKSREKYGLPEMSDTPIDGGFRLLGLDEKLKRIYQYLPKDYPFEQSVPALYKYKVFISESYGCGEIGDVPATPVLATPADLCTETFIQIGCFETEQEAANLLSYIKTKFFRALVGIRKQTQHATRTVYSFVPQQDFSKSWTDKSLYAKYGLDKEEIAFIEKMVREME